MLKQFEVSTIEIYEKRFLKVPVLNRSTKAQWSAPFVEHPVFSLLSPQSEQKLNASAILSKF